jgi:two-component system sensor histidine kinase PilS (NtrC family)
MQSMFDERLWLAWLAKVRIIILTLLFGIELAIARLTPNPFPLRLFINVILLWYTISIFYLVLLSFWEERRIQALLQVVTDLVLVTLVVYATGGVDSSLNFLYPLVIIVACILLPRVWAYLSGALAFILYVTVLELTYFEVIPSYSTTHPGMGALQAIIFVNLFGYLAVAYLAGLLAAKLRQVDVKLKHTSGALADLQALHENIIQSISGGLITTGLDGYVTLANTAAQKLFERPEAEFIGQPISRIFLDPLPTIGSEQAHGEVRFVASNGFCKTLRVMATALAVPGRSTMGCVYTFDDLTEIRRLERDLRIQDRLAAVGRLAAAIAHEIRNPLTSIAGSVSMLSGIADLSDEHRQLLQIVMRESDRLNGIITDFLAYSRGKQYKFSNVDLLPLLEDTLTLLEHRLVSENTGIRIERVYSVPNAFTMADGDKLKQVFWNFCENAVRAMHSGGVLKVSVEAIGEDWQINFADTGPGMSRQLVEKIFEPFQSQFEGGTGLGLAIVYQIVQAHEGKVWARSKLGEGSVFVLRLRRVMVAEKVPALQAPALQPAETPQPSSETQENIAAAAGIGGRAHG